MPEVVFKRGVWGLIPADIEAQEAIKHIAIGDPVRVNVKGKPRNYEHLQKWWALMSLVAANWPGPPVTKDQVCEKVKLGIGYFDWVDAKLPGEPKPSKIPVTRSISDKAIDQAEFNAFYDQGVEFIRINLWPTLTDDEIKQQVEGFAG